MILVSACLLGINCRYDGKNSIESRIVNLMNNEILIPACPEILGGMMIPREPCEICIKDDTKIVCSNQGNDYTSKYIKGAQETLKIARLYSIEKAILKENSPSCGSENIYDGSFSDTKISGEGITSELLKKNGIEIFNEKNYFD